MVKRKREAGNFKEFLAEYEAAQPSKEKKTINTSKFSLTQQLKRFDNFSHSESECEVIDREISLL
jgi:hypothetical protein